MKVTYKTQTIISVIIIILANIITETLNSWIYRSIGFVLCGVIWVIHPVLPKGAEISKRTLLWVRIAGIILIIMGDTTEGVTAVVSSVIAYCVSEGYVDGKKLESSLENKLSAKENENDIML